MKEIQIFKNELFGEIRTLTNERGEPLFVGKDVAEALGNITEDGVKFNIGLLQQYEALKRKGRPVALFTGLQAVLFVLGSPDMHVSVSSGCTLSRHSVCVCGCSLLDILWFEWDDFIEMF